jgi:hypothetical protein
VGSRLRAPLPSLASPTMRIPRWPLIAAALAACRGQASAPPATPPPGYPYAYAVADCAPWDGAAVTLYLTARAADSTDFPWPQLRISVWRGVATLSGQTFSWPADQQVGSAARCTGPDSCQLASAARITFAPAPNDTSLAGFTELTFPGGEMLRGGFRAAWRRTRVMCG